MGGGLARLVLPELSVTEGPVRVTHVVFDLNGGGLESLIAAMARRFAGSEIRLSVITLSGRAGRLGEAVRPLLDALQVHRPIRGLSLIAPLGLVKRLRAMRPHVVHLHSGAWLKGALAARLARVPNVVYTEHGREHDDPWVQRVLDRRAAALTDWVVPVSDRLRRYLRDVVRVPEARLETIENGIDVALFSHRGSTDGLRGALGIEGDALVVGSVGRLERVKAYDRLIDAFALVVAAVPASPQLHLVLCGDGAERAALERRAAELGVGARVHFTGWLDDPVACYRLLDVFALTSLSEGASVSLMEAMACGAVPVVTDTGANAEILGPELGSQVVRPAEPQAIARTLAATLESSERRARLKTIARERIVARYNLDRVAAQYERLYRGTPVRAR
jgi:glycosyltransferase involved in cell wall biosynthesis